MPVATKKNLYSSIRILQLVRSAVLLVGAIALFILLKDQTVPVNTLFITQDALASQEQTVFVPGIKSLFDAPLGIMAGVALLVSGLVALFRVTRGEMVYEQTIKKTSDWLKWLDLGVSAAIMIEIVALLAGVSDPAVLKICAGLIVITCVLGWLADHQNTGTRREWSTYLVSIFTGILPWLVIGEALLFTSVYGSVRLPWYSYALAGAVLVGFTLLALNQFLHIKRHKQWKLYHFVERNYIIIDLAMKTAFATILIVGLGG